MCSVPSIIGIRLPSASRWVWSDVEDSSEDACNVILHNARSFKVCLEAAVIQMVSKALSSLEVASKHIKDPKKRLALAADKNKEQKHSKVTSKTCSIKMHMVPSSSKAAASATLHGEQNSQDSYLHVRAYR